MNASNHPWKLEKGNILKLKAARKEAKRIYEKTSEVRNDEFRKLKQAQSQRMTYRKKVGIPLDAPLHTRAKSVAI